MVSWFQRQIHLLNVSCFILKVFREFHGLFTLVGELCVESLLEIVSM
jgi:hypothetical protein